jgi:hypothetical protein
MIPREWIISHRCSWMVVYIFCCNAQSKSHSDPRDICMLFLFYQLPTVICLPNMLLFIIWRYTTIELWTPGPISFTLLHHLLLLALFTFSHTTTVFHSICSYLYLQQTDEIDNLIVSWEQSTWLCCMQVPRCY